MDYKQFLLLVDEEIEYMQAFDLSYEPEFLKAAGALITLKEYIEVQLKEPENTMLIQ